MCFISHIYSFYFYFFLSVLSVFFYLLLESIMLEEICKKQKKKNVYKTLGCFFSLSRRVYRTMMIIITSKTQY